jgi:hypothetical protein
MKLGINIMPSCFSFPIINITKVAFQIGVTLTSFNIDPESLYFNMKLLYWFFTDESNDVEVKVKLFLGLINEDVWGSGVIDSTFLTSALDRSSALPQRKQHPVDSVKEAGLATQLVRTS